MVTKRFKAMRKAVGLTQTKLAEMLGVTEPAIALWETGRREPSHDMLIKISQILNVPIDYLLGNGLYAYCEYIQEHSDTFRDSIANIDIAEEPELVNALVTRYDNAPNIIDKIKILSVFIRDLSFDGDVVTIYWNFK